MDVQTKVGGEQMGLGRTTVAFALAVVATAATAATATQKGPEAFSAKATIETAGGAKASAPVRIVIERTTPADEGQRLQRAFTTGGEAALRQALTGLSSTGSVTIGNAPPTAARITLDRPTDKGRLLTIVTDKPILFLGGGFPDAKAKEGYGFAVVDIEIDGDGNGSGTLSTAAKVKVAKGAFVVDDYAAQPLRLVDVRRTK
jgi:hypothetical protein